jgi:hypothetical protein
MFSPVSPHFSPATLTLQKVAGEKCGLDAKFIRVTFDYIHRIEWGQPVFALLRIALVLYCYLCENKEKREKKKINVPEQYVTIALNNLGGVS